MCQKVLKYTKMCQNCVRMNQNVTKLSQNEPKCVKICQNCAKICQNVPNYQGGSPIERYSVGLIFPLFQRFPCKIQREISPCKIQRGISPCKIQSGISPCKLQREALPRSPLASGLRPEDSGLLGSASLILRAIFSTGAASENFMIIHTRRIGKFPLVKNTGKFPLVKQKGKLPLVRAYAF